MTQYVVELTSAAAKQLRKLDAEPRRRITVALASLATDPRPPGSTKLVGEDTAYRVRVGEYRILYDVVDEVVTVTVFRIAHRREVYRP